MAEKICAIVGATEGKRRFAGHNESIILKWILKEWGGRLWTETIWLKTDQRPALVNTINNFRFP
jgi:hypothetical protein